MTTTNKPSASDYWGLCPKCKSEPEILNVGRNHFGACHTHKVRWHIGSNLFDGCQNEANEVWAQNEALLRSYEMVNPDGHLENVPKVDMQPPCTDGSSPF
jgi:hypothetical protein